MNAVAWLGPRRLAVALLALAAAGVAAAEPGNLLGEPFVGPIEREAWEVVRVHDTKSERIETSGGRLTVALDTIGTNDATVKVRGVATKSAFSLGGAVYRFAAAIDWASQTNGCYLSAGLALVPEGHPADKDPRAAAEGVSFEWIGVPPGKNVRPYLSKRVKGALVELYTEGWPQPKREDRVGRAPSKERITLEVGKSSLRLLEGEKELYKGADGLSGKYKLVLFVTGHSNYPARTVHFEGASVAEVRSGS